MQCHLETVLARANFCGVWQGRAGLGQLQRIDFRETWQVHAAPKVHFTSSIVRFNLPEHGLTSTGELEFPLRAFKFHQRCRKLQRTVVLEQVHTSCVRCQRKYLRLTELCALVFWSACETVVQFERIYTSRGTCHLKLRTTPHHLPTRSCYSIQKDTFDWSLLLETIRCYKCL